MNYLYGGLVLIAFVLFYLALYNFKKSRNLLENGKRTSAKVIRLIEVSDDDGVTYKPVFEYKDYQQNLQTFTSTVSSRPSAYRVGDRVQIVYSLSEKDQRVVSFWGLYRWTILLLCFAAPLAIIGLGYFWYKSSSPLV